MVDKLFYWKNVFDQRVVKKVRKNFEFTRTIILLKKSLIENKFVDKWVSKMISNMG